MHRLATNIEAAGFIIIDQAAWVYRTGRPPSKQHLKPAHEPIVVARASGPPMPINVDAGRIPWLDEADRARASRIDSLRAGGKRNTVYQTSMDAYGRGPFKPNTRGRWPSTCFDVPKTRALGDHVCAKPQALIETLIAIFVPISPWKKSPNPGATTERLIKIDGTIES